MLGRAASEGLVPWGTGGFEPPGTAVEDVEVEARTRGAGSGLDSAPRAGFLSGEPGSDLVAGPGEVLVSDGLDLATEEQQKEPT